MEFLFTQEQYEEIKKVADASFIYVYETGLQDSLSSNLRDYIFLQDLEAEAMELANPNTRASAKLKYVEPEPLKYSWWYSAARFINKKGEVWYLDNNEGRYDDVQTTFTEEEIDASPFKKESFIKKE